MTDLACRSCRGHEFRTARRSSRDGTIVCARCGEFAGTRTEISDVAVRLIDAAGETGLRELGWHSQDPLRVLT